jgi:acetyltransferase-like isoleucine patch superfamily enzyme
MNEWLIRWRKLKFKLTPPRWRSPFCKDDPWLAKYEVGEWTYGRIKVLNWGNKARLRIGRFCAIGGGVTIFLAGEHHTEWVSTYPFTVHLGENAALPDPVKSKGDVTIGNDVWIGDRATILSGVRVGNGAVIGARSLVVKDVAPYQIVGGNPARPLRTRFTPDQIAALERIAWWEWPLDRIRAALPLLTSDSVDEFITRHS